MNIDVIPNKIIISGSAGTGKTYLVKNHLDIDNKDVKDEKRKNPLLKKMSEEDLKKVDVDTTFIFSISRSASVNTYHHGVTITSFLFKRFKKMSFCEKLYHEYLDAVKLYIDQICHVTDLYMFESTTAFKIGKKTLYWPGLFAWIILDEDNIRSDVSDREHNIIMRETFNESDYIRIMNLRRIIQNIIWEYIDMFVDLVNENQKEFQVTEKRNREIRVVFEEFSMIPTDKINAVLTLLQNSRFIKYLFFVGDIAQLPPIDGNNIMNDDFWVSKLDDFKIYKLMKLWRFKKNEMIQEIAKLPYVSYDEKVKICDHINEIMYGRIKDKKISDVDFMIAYTNEDCVKVSDIKSNAFRRTDQQVRYFEELKEMSDSAKDFDDIFKIVDEKEKEKREVSQDSLFDEYNFESVADYFNKLDQTNRIYKVNKTMLNQLIKNAHYFNLSENAIYNKVFSGFYNSGIKCMHSATVHKMQGITIESGIRTFISLRGNRDVSGLAYTAITRNADFNDIHLACGIKPSMFYIPSLYNFEGKMIELHDDYWENIQNNFRDSI